mmetsp:Transcript_150816/g.262093  ORF Transcript_150816/g.262093 Transcript_150816/m.262093 type:complete len:200 (-) Transcript_150816:13-612(-)
METALKVSGQVSSCEARVDKIEESIGVEVRRVLNELGVEHSGRDSCAALPVDIDDTITRINESVTRLTQMQQNAEIALKVSGSVSSLKARLDKMEEHMVSGLTRKSLTSTHTGSSPRLRSASKELQGISTTGGVQHSSAIYKPPQWAQKDLQLPVSSMVVASPSAPRGSFRTPRAVAGGSLVVPRAARSPGPRASGSPG